MRSIPIHFFLGQSLRCIFIRVSEGDEEKAIFKKVATGIRIWKNKVVLKIQKNHRIRGLVCLMTHMLYLTLIVQEVSGEQGKRAKTVRSRNPLFIF